MSYIINAQTDFDDSIVEKISMSYTIRVPSAPNFPENAVSPSRYVVRLYSVPYLADQTTYPITVGALTKVTASPSSGQFRIVDSITRTRPHMIEFNAAQAGTAYTVAYYAISSIIDHQQIGFVGSGSSASYPIYVLNDVDHGVNLTTAIDDLPTGNKVIFLKNGDYNITTVLNLATHGVVEFIGESTEGVRITCTIASANQFLIDEAIIKNFTMISTVSNSYGAIVGATGVTGTKSKVQNVHVIGSGNTGYGIYECSNVSGCYVEGVNIGIYTCHYVSQCYCTLNIVGIQSCRGVTISQFYDNDYGIVSCYQVSDCLSNSNTYTGIEQSSFVSQCYVYSNGTYGFSNCLALSKNYTNGNTTQNYNQTGGALNYASVATNATYVIAVNGTDTPNGGFNT